MATRYWVGDGGTWDASDTTHWGSASGVADNASVPGPTDAAIFDAASFSIPAQTVTIGSIGVGSINFTGVDNNPTITLSAEISVYGNLTLVTGMTFNAHATYPFHITGNCALTSAGKSFNTVYIDTGTVTLTLQDAAIILGTLYPKADSVLNTNAKSLSVHKITGESPHTITATGSVITFTGAAPQFDLVSSLLTGGEIRMAVAATTVNLSQYLALANSAITNSTWYVNPAVTITATDTTFTGSTFHNITVDATAASNSDGGGNSGVLFSVVATGSGPTRGGGKLSGTVYVFRDNLAGTAKNLWKSSAAGWVQVPLYSQISFTDGVAAIADGASITQVTTGASATVKRVVKESGDWGSNEISFGTGVGEIFAGDTITQDVSGAVGVVLSVGRESGTWGTDAAGKIFMTIASGTFDATNVLRVGGITRATATSLATAYGDAAGRLILFPVYGTFDATNAIQVSAATKATASSLVTAITLLPAGRYETVNCNFGAGLRMYGCDGINSGFEFDGTVYVPISTGMTSDIPNHVAHHKNRLWLSFGRSLQNSGAGLPYEWTATVGANEIAMGDTITNLLPWTGKALGIVSENSVRQLVGNDESDWVLDVVADDVGGLAYCAQNLAGVAMVLGGQGLVRIAAAQEYGNFSQSAVGLQAQPVIDAMLLIAVASSVYRTRSQWRIYGSDGTGLCITASVEGNAPAYYVTPFEYPVGVYAVFNGDDDTVYLCSSETGSGAGMVYQADKGSSFDGAAIEAYFRLAFNSSKSPTTVKSYQRATLECATEGYSSVRFHPEFSYADGNIQQHILETVIFGGLGGYWDVSTWGEFSYDSKVVDQPSIALRGNGTNMAIIAYSNSDIDLGHKFDGVITHFLPRRITR